ncbi:hypothetical protein KI387_034516, partial [Taxus chinensis]
EAFSLFSLDEEDPCEDGDDNLSFSWMHGSRASGLDCGSRSGSPLLMRDGDKTREQKAKCNKKIYSNISKYIGRQKDDSQTPTSVRSLNNDGKFSIHGSCDGTAFSGDDEMDDDDSYGFSNDSRDFFLEEFGRLSLNRPRSFDELVGQKMAVQSLVNAVLKGKVAPVYLFQGPRGTGNTTNSS